MESVGQQRSVPASQASTGIERTEIHHVLSNDRRRYVLSELQAATEPLTARTLSELAAERETGESPAPRDVRQSVYVSLLQTHLPKLKELNIVADHEDGITLTAQASVVTDYLATDSTTARPWGAYYFGLASIGLAVQLAGLVEIPLVEEVAFSGVVIVLILCVLLAAYHLASDSALGSKLVS